MPFPEIVTPSFTWYCGCIYLVLIRATWYLKILETHSRVWTEYSLQGLCLRLSVITTALEWTREKWHLVLEKHSVALESSRSLVNSISVDLGQRKNETLTDLEASYKAPQKFTLVVFSCLFHPVSRPRALQCPSVLHRTTTKWPMVICLSYLWMKECREACHLPFITSKFSIWFSKRKHECKR